MSRTVGRSDGQTVDGTPPAVPPSDHLTALANTITRCNRCPRLRAHCREIARIRKRAHATDEYWGRPVPSLGDPLARLLVIGLAPAAHGANRTGQLFTGDASGSWLYEALHRFGFSNRPNALWRDDGLVLTDCWITASAHCAPPQNRPTPAELARCRPYLEAELTLLPKVEIVLALGRVSWETWLRAAGWWQRLPPRERPAFGHGVETEMPDGRVLVTSFHPSRQNTNTGKLTREMWYGVFERIRRRLVANR
jgi:uracil-DNA glycosylase family 4